MSDQILSIVSAVTVLRTDTTEVGIVTIDSTVYSSSDLLIDLSIPHLLFHALLLDRGHPSRL